MHWQEVSNDTGSTEIDSKLRTHPISRFKVGSRLCDELLVRRMIRSFYADNVIADYMIVPLDMLHQFEYCRTRSSDEPFLGRLQRIDHFVKKLLVLRRPIAGYVACLVVKVAVVIFAIDFDLIKRVTIGKEDPRLAMIDPNDCMIMRH